MEGAQPAAAAASFASAEQEESVEITRPCSLLMVTGELLAELQPEAEWTVRVLAQQVALLVPLTQPQRTRYAFVFGTRKLRADDALATLFSQLEEGEGLTLTVVVEQVPWSLSTTGTGKGNAAELLFEEGSEDSVAARRAPSSAGAVVMSKYPVPWLEAATACGDGEFSFEVVVDGTGDRDTEGLDVGVTTAPPEQMTQGIPSYAIRCHPSWVSSDGRIWVNGNPSVHGLSVKPSSLKIGDVVRFSVLREGGIEIKKNDTTQALWKAAGVPASEPLYAVVGMRAPCSAVTVRLPDTVV